MKKFLLILALFAITSGKAQQQNWELYASVKGVEIYTTHAECFPKNIPDQKGILIKVVNTTDKSWTVEWDKAIWYNNEPVKENVVDSEMHYVIEIGKNETKVGSCDEPRGALYIYEDFITYKSDTKLTRFELNNIKVSRN